jgi:predicted permease
LITSQVALSLLLLAGALLLVTTLQNLRTFDFGFDREHVLTMRLETMRAGYEGERRLAYLQAALERARTIPGVRAAALAFGVPAIGAGMDTSFRMDGRPTDSDVSVYLNDVSDGYFETTGTRLVAGRDFGAQDRLGSTPVAIVNDTVARRYFGTGSPIGQRIDLGMRGALEIVGVVETSKYQSLREADSPIVYAHALQRSEAGAITLLVKTDADPESLAESIRREIQNVAAVPVTQPSTLSAQIDRTLVKERLIARVLGALAVLALLLASAGLYGVLAYAVTRRTNEIGIRMALGAERRTVFWSVLRESWALVAIGVAIGIPAALALTRLLSSLLYGITPTDPWILSAAVACLFAVALAAASQPAWRAMHVDPLVALRYE